MANALEIKRNWTLSEMEREKFENGALFLQFHVDRKHFGNGIEVISLPDDERFLNA